MIGCFKQRDMVATVMKIDGRLHPRGAAAHNRDALAALRGENVLLQLILNADLRIDGADKMVVIACAIVTFEALNAGPHILAPPGVGLVPQFRVGNNAPGDGNEVCLAAGDDLLGLLQILNGANGHHRDADPGLLDGLGVLDIGGIRQKAGGMGGGKIPGVVHAAGAVEQVYPTLQQLYEFNGFLGCDALRIHFGDREPQLNEKILAAAAFDLVDDHQGIAGAVFQAAAEFIGAVIIPLGEELSPLAAVADVEHTHIKSGLFDDFGGVSEHFDLLFNERPGHFHAVSPELFEAGAYRIILVIAILVGELHGGHGTKMMHPGGELVEAPQSLGGIGVHMEVIAVGFHVGIDLNAGAGDHGRAALGAVAKVGDDRFLKAGLPVLEGVHAGGRGKNAVFEQGISHLHGRKQMGIGIHSMASLICNVVGLCSAVLC